MDFEVLNPNHGGILEKEPKIANLIKFLQKDKILKDMSIKSVINSIRSYDKGK